METSNNAQDLKSSLRRENNTVREMRRGRPERGRGEVTRDKAEEKDENKCGEISVDVDGAEEEGVTNIELALEMEVEEKGEQGGGGRGEKRPWWHWEPRGS